MTQNARFLLYAHDGQGLGHTRRSLAIARALTHLDDQAAVLVATGTESPELFEIPPRVDILRLPAIRKVTNTQYISRRLSLTRPEIGRLRSGVLEATVEAFEPDVILADKHPAGVGGELLPALELNRAHGRRAAAGFRDILDDPATVRAEWAQEDTLGTIARHHQRILVYGQPDIVDHVRDYRIPAHLAARVEYCGYVTDAGALPVTASLPGRRPLVIATAGGGEDGCELFEAFLGAADGAGWDAHLVAGPMAAAFAGSLRARCAGAGVTFHTTMPALAGVIASADAVVCMGGYNTLLEVVAAGTPAVCLPRRYPRTEQAIRAERFAAMGLVSTLESSVHGALRAAVDRALVQDRRLLRARTRERLDLNGAVNAARSLLELAAHETKDLVAAGGVG